MAKPPRPIPLPLLARINAIIVDLAALADAIEAESRDELGTGKPEENRSLGFGRREQRVQERNLGDRDSGNVIPFPLGRGGRGPGR